MINVCTGLWDANRLSKPFSRHYTEEDVEKLYRGFARHLNVPFRFICWSERDRTYSEPIEQRRFNADVLNQGMPHYGSLTQLYELNEPMILVGLDTVVVGNCDSLAAYCIAGDKPAAPVDPFFPSTVCNGVVLVPGGCGWMYHEFQRERPNSNDMDWIRDLYKAGRLVALDKLFPNQIVSYKGHTMKHGLEEETRIVYFHGEKKPHELGHVGWIDRHWAQNVTEAA